MSNCSSSGQRKISEYEFLRKLNSPVHVVAPMVDQSDLAYRMLTRKYGAHLVYTQMFNANSFLNSKECREECFTTCEQDRPLIVQFAGHDAKVLLEAAKLVEDKCDAIDINLGCPQGIAKRGMYGAFLMDDLDLLKDIVTTLSQNLSIPVTCKIRIFKDYTKTIRLCETLINAGASLLTIHGRTKEEKQQDCGNADWHMIKKICQHFKGRCPIFANGGIEFFSDIQKCMDYTGCDGVMTSEAVLENPAFFYHDHHHITQIDITREYLHTCYKYPVWHFKAIRSHVLKFLYRYLTSHVDIRIEISEMNSIEELLSVCDRIDDIVKLDSQYTETWYRRYRRHEEVIENRNRDETENSENYITVKVDQQTLMHRKPNVFDEQEGKDDECDCIFDSLGM